MVDTLIENKDCIIYCGHIFCKDGHAQNIDDECDKTKEGRNAVAVLILFKKWGNHFKVLEHIFLKCFCKTERKQEDKVDEMRLWEMSEMNENREWG